jgi:hypothetical protein
MAALIISTFNYDQLDEIFEIKYSTRRGAVGKKRTFLQITISYPK